MFFSARPFHFFCGASSLLFPLLRPAFFFLRGFFPSFSSPSPRFLLPLGLFHFFFFSFAPLSSFSGTFPFFLLLFAPPDIIHFISSRALTPSPSPQLFFSARHFPLIMRIIRHHTSILRAPTLFPRRASRLLSARLPHSRTYEQKERLPRMHNTLCTSKKPLLLFYHCLIGLPPTPLSHC